MDVSIDFEGGGTFSPGLARRRMRKAGEEGDEKQRVGNALKAGRPHECFVGDTLTGLGALALGQAAISITPASARPALK